MTYLSVVRIEFKLNLKFEFRVFTSRIDFDPLLHE